ncbi:MAG: hypothetical protein ABJG14_04895 [Sulfitobacter sp.]|uniref:hypothetical protein n=2 Tax=Pseudomonadota TaxID=1224 RepID=UPI003263A166
MPKLSQLIIASAIMSYATFASAQMTPEDLKALVDSRSGNLSGFQELLDDPNPRRSLAAVEGMLTSGDSNLERMALTFALTNPDTAIRATALEHHFAKLPPVAISFDATKLSDDEMKVLIKVLKSLGGSIGPDKLGSFNFQPAAYDEQLGCYPQVYNERICAMRLGRGFVGLYFWGSNVSGHWVNFTADETGTLRGGTTFEYAGTNAGSVPMTIRLIN